MGGLCDRCDAKDATPLDFDSVKEVLGGGWEDVRVHVVCLVVKVHLLLKGADFGDLTKTCSVVGAKKAVEVEGSGLDNLGGWDDRGRSGC